MHGVSYERIPESSAHDSSGQRPMVTKDVEMSSDSPAGTLKGEIIDAASIGDTTKETVRKNVSLGLTVVLGLSIVLLIFSLLSSEEIRPGLGGVATNADFDDRGRYVMTNYDVRKPMANFLAGVGGIWGIPMWAFYVNRGQGLTSFGVQNKDGAIQGFATAEKAYQDTSFTGFRTFLKGERNGNCFTHMPFFPTAATDSPSSTKYQRDMHIGMNEFEIFERAEDIELDTSVLYFTVPDEDFPAMVRQVTFKNIGKDALKLDVLDGLAKLIPSGLTNIGEATMGRTLEAWMKVYNVGNGMGDSSSPFFHITQGTADTSTVQLIKEGHFAASYIEGENEPVPFIVDPSIVFGTDTSLLNPKAFFDSTEDMKAFMAQTQGTTARTPCAFAGTNLNIAPGSETTITTIFGHSPDLETFISIIDGKVRAKGFAAEKRKAAIDLTEGIVQTVKTDTNLKIFDDYVKQDYLDNVLRGGLPLPLGEDQKIFHVYSRIHGDIERDYNDFQIDTSYFSQGPGNFRDVNQNRRLDVQTNPVVGDFNVRNFLSFVQADGYNPLTVASTNFRVYENKMDDVLDSLHIIDEHNLGMRDKVKDILTRPYRPGKLFQDFAAGGIELGVDKETALSKVVTDSEQVFAAQYAQNGFWTDHWTYTLDLIMSFLAVFPDKEEWMLWDSEPVPFYMSPSFVKTRSDRYVLVDNPNRPGTKTVVVQMAVCGAGDLSGCYPADREGTMEHIWVSDDFVGDGAAGGVWQRTDDDETYYTTTIGKLALLGMIKFSTMDPQGMGVDMEGGKPGWNDAMNGLPGLLGSGMPETYETLRILRYVQKAVRSYNRGISFPVEFSEMLSAIMEALATYEASSKDDAADHAYWDATNIARENYRAKLLLTFKGTSEELGPERVLDILSKMIAKIDGGIKKAVALNGGLSPTYFHYECTEYKTSADEDTVTVAEDGTETVTPGATHISATKFKRHDLPEFLEGPTRHLKIVDEKSDKRNIYQLVRNSELYDEALKMYTVSASLKTMGPEVGRMVAFSPGWLENESVWLHMSYKFYLELLRGGLYEEFYHEIKTGLVPFMDVDIYGRSPLEAASFIASSAFPDKKLHGTGYLARLSGSTAEFLSLWSIMFMGEFPFTHKDGTLTLSLKPVLPSWLFKDDGTVSFTFLGSVDVKYHNRNMQNTWEMKVGYISVGLADGNKITVHGGEIKGDLAESVRDGSSVRSIDLYYK